MRLDCRSLVKLLCLVGALGLWACTENNAVTLDDTGTGDGPVTTTDGQVNTDGQSVFPDMFLSDSDALPPTPDTGTPSDGAQGQEGSPPPPDSGPAKCTSAADCSGYACIVTTGVCRTTCTQQSHCASGYVCNASNQCVAVTTCSSAAQCTPYACNLSTGQCYVQCNGDTQCASGYQCDPVNDTCFKPTTCTADAQCSGYTCNASQGVCYTYCSNWGPGGGVPCATGYICSNNQCLKSKTCTADADCGGYQCDNGTCLISCTSTSNHCDTANNYICDFVTNTCIKGTSCNSDSDCSGYDCYANICRTSCTAPNHCDTQGGYACAGATNTCVKQPSSCTSDAQCNGYDCDNGDCDMYCTNWSGCANGYQCTQNICSPSTP